MFETVIKMDPGFAGGYAGVSAMLSLGAMLSHVDASEPIAQAVKMAQKAVSVDETFGWSYTSLGMALLHRKQYDDAIAAALEAITRQPSDADAYAFLGLIQGLGGQYAAGVGLPIESGHQPESVLLEAIRIDSGTSTGPTSTRVLLSRCWLEITSRRSKPSGKTSDVRARSGLPHYASALPPTQDLGGRTKRPN